MKKLKDFVNKYKDIFTTDLPHMTSDSNKKIIFDIVKLMTIIAALSTIIGYLTNTIENLSYVVYTIHTIFLGSLIIYMYVYEIKNHNKESELDPLIVSIIKSLPFISVILFSNGILFATYLNEASTIFNVYLFIVLGVLSYVFLLMVDAREFVFKKTIYRNVIINIVSSFLIYIGIFRVLPFTNINITYIIGTTMIYCIFFIKNLLLPYQKDIKNIFLFKIVLVVIMIVISAKFYFSGVKLNLDDYLESEFNVSSTISFDDFEFSSIFTNENYYILHQNYDYGYNNIDNYNLYRIYDFDMNLITELSMLGPEYLYEFENSFYIVSQVYDFETKIRTYTFKTLDQNFDIVKEEIIINDGLGNYIPFEENSYAFIHKYQEVNNTFLTVFNSIDQTSYELHHDDFEENEIIYHTEETVLFTLNNVLYFINERMATVYYGDKSTADNSVRLHYSNGYILLREENKATIISFEDFYSNNYKNEIVIHEYVLDFHFDGTNFYTFVNDISSGYFFNIYNMNGESISSVDYKSNYNSRPSFTNKFQFVNNQIITYSDNNLLVIDADDAVHININQKISIQDKFLSSSLLFMGVILLSSSFIIVRGEKYE